MPAVPYTTRIIAATVMVGLSASVFTLLGGTQALAESNSNIAFKHTSFKQHSFSNTMPQTNAPNLFFSNASITNTSQTTSPNTYSSFSKSTTHITSRTSQNRQIAVRPEATSTPQTPPSSHPAQHGGVTWHTWSDDVFEQAKRENKLVILDLEAVWCHWCHVMHEKTYSNPDVQAALNKNYIAIRVDQDSRPDLSNRYQDYGWPATILFAPDGTEIVKRSGFIPPQTLSALLTKAAADPSPEKTADLDTASIQAFADSPYLSADLRANLEGRYFSAYDEEYGSWGRGGHKFLDPDSMELTFLKLKTGEPRAKEMALKTLDGQINLQDPVWGGMYQYSTGGVWTNKHFEKIMSVQTENIRIFAQGYAQFQDPKYLAVAKKNVEFLNTFLKSPEGGYYTSMDADVVPGEHSEAYFDLNDAERRKIGIPRIDKHQYARENGWVIAALAAMYEATGESSYLTDAEETARWVQRNRALSPEQQGGFRHDAKDAAGPYLGDSLAMGRAFLSLYKVTGKREWLKQAEETAYFIQRTFQNTNGKPGYLSAAAPKTTGNKVNTARPLRDENVAMTRFANALHHVTGNADYKQLTEQGMRFLATPDIANIPFSASTLLPDTELQQTPLHLTIVGHKDDAAAQALFQAALRYPVAYKRVDWWDKREGPMPNPDVQYPELPKPAAFVCTAKRCSLPVFKPEALAPLVDRLTQAKISLSPKAQ